MLINTSWGIDSITLMWDSPQDAGRSFEIYSDALETGDFTKLVYAGNKNYAVVKQLTEDETLYYRMRYRIDGGAWSSWSNVCAATPSSDALTRVYFATVGDTAEMQCDGATAYNYYFSDGRDPVGSADPSVTGLGLGVHIHYLTVDTPNTVSSFGRPSIESVYAIDGLNYFPAMHTIMVYANSACETFGRINLCAGLRNYHIMDAGLTNEHMDSQFVDMLIIDQTPGDWYAPTATGTVVSYAERIALQTDGWVDIATGPTPAATQNVTYDGNGNESGSVPSDTTDYTYRQSVTVLGNTGNIARDGYTFAGWNTAGNGTGLHYDAADTFLIQQPTTLYAEWEVSESSTYTVTYDGNENTDGTVPIDANSPYAAGGPVTVLDNTGSLIRTGHTFTGWNTLANGLGTHYDALDIFNIVGNTILYAEWAADTYSVTYDGNENTSGVVPDTQTKLYGVTLTLRSNSGALARTDYIFSGWNTAADGSGTDYAESADYTVNAAVVLYARWEAVVPSYTIDITSEGQIFAPLIAVTGTPEILWTFADATTSNELNPSKDYGTVGSRVNTLTVTPWSALTMLNLGYDAWDSGSLDIPLHDADNVSAIAGLNNAAGMEILCVSNNLQLSTLDISGLTNLHTLESALNWNLQTFIHTGATALQRLCLEDCDVHTLDISDCADIRDLRYADNGSTSLILPAVALGLWHICIRDNPGIVVTPQNLTYPALTELWNWGCGLNGDITVTADSVRSILSYSNGYTSFTLTNPMAYPYDLNLRGNALSRESVSALLTQMDALTVDPGDEGTILLDEGTNGAPLDLVAYDNLIVKGWTVAVNAPPLPTYNLTYDGNGSTGGTVPVDTTDYDEGALAPVVGNTGNLIRTGHSFGGWAYDVDGLMAVGETVEMLADTTIYAVWVPGVYGVTYDDNGSTGGTVPVDAGTYPYETNATVLDNTGDLIRTNYIFIGWRLAPAGGAIYEAGDDLLVTQEMTLYACWIPKNGAFGGGSTAVFSASIWEG